MSRPDATAKAKDKIGAYIGRRFTILKPDILKPDMFFPHDFTVVEERDTLIHVKNALETYWVTRTRFETSMNSVFYGEAPTNDRS